MDRFENNAPTLLRGRRCGFEVVPRAEDTAALRIDDRHAVEGPARGVFTFGLDLPGQRGDAAVDGDLQVAARGVASRETEVFHRPAGRIVFADSDTRVDRAETKRGVGGIPHQRRGE